MCFIDLLNEYSGLLSLIASVIVAFLIYWMQRRHERENEREAKRRQKEMLSESARVFLIDNQNEIEYLPLCVVAASVNEYAKHERKIYNRFNRCAPELQHEILVQRNIPIAIARNADWVSEYLEKLIADAENNALGKSMLYDGGKYFHKGFEYYSTKKVDDINERIFEIPFMSKILPPDPNRKVNLTLYIDRYLEFVLKNRADTKDKPELLPQVPPYDILWSKQALGSCDEWIMSFWAMKVVFSTCIAFFRHNIVGTDGQSWREMSEYGEIETFEDLYYASLLTLYEAYAPMADINESDVIRRGKP